jgi:hypothetical protein
MASSEESRKVHAIVKRLEEDLQGELFFRDETNKIGQLTPLRVGFGSELGRPDALIWVELELPVLGVPVKLKVPILVEAEEAGMDAAKDDYELFFQRKEIEIPMVVVGSKGARRKTKQSKMQARVNITVHQIGFDRI